MLITKKTIAIDQDQVLADLATDWLKLYNKDYNDNLTPEDVTDWDMTKFVKPECGKRIFGYLNDYNLFRNLSVVKDSQEVVEELSRFYDVYITTSASEMPNALAAKVYWLEEHFSFIPKSNIVLCGDKSIVNADIMIDDGVHNLDVFEGKKKYLFAAPHNRFEARYTRVNGWKHITEILLRNPVDI